MHVSNAVSPAPAPSTPRSDARSKGTGASGFGSVYEAGQRQASGSDKRDDAAPREKSDAPRDRADAPRGKADARRRTDAPGEKAGAKEDAPRGTSEDAGPTAEEVTEGTVEVAPVAEAAAPLPTAEVPSAGMGDSPAPEPAEVPEEAALAPVETAAPRPARAEVAELSDGRARPRAAADAASVAADPASADAKPVAAAADEPVTATTIEKAQAEAPKPTAPAAPPPAAQPAAQPAASQSARPEEVVVRRVRTESRAEPSQNAEAGAESAPRTAEPKAPKPAAPNVAAIDPLPKIAADAASRDVVDPALAEVAPAEARSTAEHAARAEATVRTDTPRPVMQQVAEAARALRDGPVELTLQPEELGKVRMTLTAGADGAMTMSLQAERPETLDLLRRHIGDLARELQDLGFDNLNFSFAQDRAPAERQWQDRAADDAASDQPVAAIPLAQHGFASRPAPVATGGLDLRL